MIFFLHTAFLQISDGFGSFNAVFSIFPFIFLLFFVVIFVFIVFTLVSSARRQQVNRSAPKVQTQATVCAKRMAVRGSDHTHSSYFATFRLSSGDLMELSVPEAEYGYLIENDEGLLTFQGTLFLSFTRG